MNNPDLTNVPADAGKIVAMVKFQGSVLVATEYRVYQIVGDGLVPLKFQEEGDGMKRGMA